MQEIDLDDLKVKLEAKLNSAFISPSVLMGRCRFIEENSRQTLAYSDPRYMPFYYHLGNLLDPKSVVDIGLGLGLVGACFNRSCKSVERYLAIQEPVKGQFYSVRMAKANIRDYYKKDLEVHYGSIIDDVFMDRANSSKWELAIIEDEVGYDRHKVYLDFLWNRMEEGGLIIMDHLSRHSVAQKTFVDFSKTKRREPVMVKTRYGVGIIKR